MHKRYTLKVVVDVFLDDCDDDEPVPTVDTDYILGGMPLMMTDELEADGYVQSISILNEEEL